MENIFESEMLGRMKANNFTSIILQITASFCKYFQ